MNILYFYYTRASQNIIYKQQKIKLMTNNKQLGLSTVLTLLAIMGILFIYLINMSTSSLFICSSN